TTIINLLSKFYLATDGVVRVDGADLKRVQTDSLRRQMGVVLQQNFIFSGTVRENIRLGRLSATDQEILEAVQRLDCLDIIDGMAKGFDTEVGERGSGLSV